jgi:hypothetical protein
MMSNILHEDSLYQLKKSIKTNLSFYNANTNEWIEKQVTVSPVFVSSKIEIPEFNLILPSKASNYDYENIIILHSNLSYITQSQASEELFWASLSHNEFWDYMQNRWPLSSNKKDPEQFIKKNYFFAHGLTRSLMTNALARLWWFGELTFNPNNEDNPYEYTRYISSDLNGKGFPLFGSNFSNNKRVLFVFLDTIRDFEKKQSFLLSRQQFIDLIHFMNLWAGNALLEVVPSDVITKRLDEELLKIVRLTREKLHVF